MKQCEVCGKSVEGRTLCFECEEWAIRYLNQIGRMKSYRLRVKKLHALYQPASRMKGAQKIARRPETATACLNVSGGADIRALIRRQRMDSSVSAASVGSAAGSSV